MNNIYESIRKLNEQDDVESSEKYIDIPGQMTFGDKLNYNQVTNRLDKIERLIVALNSAVGAFNRDTVQSIKKAVRNRDVEQIEQYENDLKWIQKHASSLIKRLEELKDAFENSIPIE